MATQKVKSSGKRSRRGTPKRNTQNQRTFSNVKKRRALHKKRFPNDVNSLELAKRWVTPPTSKAA